MGKKLTQNEFIERAEAIHGSKYDYSLVEYINTQGKVNILCKEHGVFPQTPSKHLMGRGCRACANKKITESRRFTTEQFIEQAKNVHGEKYDYSKVEYLKNNVDVIIICPIHGESRQRPSNHLNGGGCFGCGRDISISLNTRSKEEFVKKCKETHGDTYDYTATTYINCKDTIEIICKKHGIFEQTADNHQRGAVCPSCNKENILQKYSLNFIKKAKEVHNDKYDYSLIEYLNNKDKLKIVCPVHGEYEQAALNHLQGNGCAECGKEKRASGRLDIDKFIKKAIDTHGDRYDYTLCDYVKHNVNVSIICKEHGVFEQSPTRHIYGGGCSKCGHEKTSKSLRHTKEQFIERAKKIHGDMYNYDLVEYIQSKKKVKIVCSTHGLFEQKPCNHLKGCGCPKCANLINVYKKIDYEKLAKKAKLYIIRCWKGEESFYKIGKTKDAIESRFANTNIKPYEYEIVHFYEGDSGDIFDLEIQLHKKYHLFKQKPLYKFSGYTECYTMELPLEEIKNLYLQ